MNAMSYVIAHHVANTTQAHRQAIEIDQYLSLTSGGDVAWISEPGAATSFASMREATRMAMRLPSGLRAYALPMAAVQLH